jgi:DNA polymerase-1
VDALSLIYQVFHALPEMTGPAGQPVAAVHGFARDVLDLLEQKQPDYLFCAFDGPGDDNFRLELYPQYKAQRAAMPDDLQLQLAPIRRLLTALGVPCLECAGFEADDLLATIARQTAELGGTCFLVTADKDCRQLINDRVKVLNLRKDHVIDAAALQQEWGVRPDQAVDYQSLVGDPVDNVPGVPLIGPKLASDLLQKYGTLEAVLDHAHEVSGPKRRENLLRYRDQALLSRALVRLHDRVPIAIEWTAGKTGHIDLDALDAICRELGIRRLAERARALGRGSARQTQAETSSTPSAAASYQTVTSMAQLRQLVAIMCDQPLVSFDTETTSTSPRFAELVGCSFGWQDGCAWYVPVRAPAGEVTLPLQEVLDALRPALEHERPAKVGQNLKYDTVVLRNYGIELQGCGFDTMVADYLLEAGERSHSLDELARRYLQYQTIPISQLIGAGSGQRRMDEVPVAQVTRYAAEDADVVWRLMPHLRRRLSDAGLTDLFDNLEMPLIAVLAEMEFQGIRVDVPRLQQLSCRFGERMTALQHEIHELAATSFNLDSPRQLAAVLFEQLGLPVSKRTKTGPSTDAEVLADLAPLHPLPAKILEYRQHAKLKSTYVDALPELVHPLTGRIHTSFKQDVAATGRLSSTDPNLQNIPVRTAAGREIRSAFLPAGPDWLLVTADYSQIELRVLAHFSQDPALLQAFAQDQDIHQLVASEVFAVPSEQVTAEMRRVAKAVNFGVIYGQTAFGLAKTLGIDNHKAAEFIERYFARYAGVEHFMRQVLEDSRRNGYVSTILGRRRAVHGVRAPSQSGSSRARNLPERIAINTVIQGSAADLIKQAMINVYGRLRRDSSRARLLLQIHDELVLEMPADQLSDWVPIIAQEMSRAGELSVPLKVDVEAGPNWEDCERVS